MAVECLIVFLAVAVADALWARYISAINSRDPIMSATLSMGIVLVNALAVVVYVENRWAVLAAGLGAFVGTYLSVRRAPGRAG
jgi:hypothetical protein